MKPFLLRFRPFLAYAALFSLFTNILLLVPALYMLQVFDRVMTTGRVETLVLLTIITAAALLVYGLLDAFRGAILLRTGAWLNDPNDYGPGWARLRDAIRARETSRYTIRYTAPGDAQFGQRYLPVEVEVTLQKTSGRDESGYYAPSN